MILFPLLGSFSLFTRNDAMPSDRSSSYRLTASEEGIVSEKFARKRARAAIEVATLAGMRGRFCFLAANPMAKDAADVVGAHDYLKGKVAGGSSYYTRRARLSTPSPLV